MGEFMGLKIVKREKEIKAIYAISFWILTVIIVLSEYLKNHVRWIIFIPLGIFAVASILNSYLRVKERNNKSDITILVLNMLVVGFIVSFFMVI